jgi:hypothetical protein
MCIYYGTTFTVKALSILYVSKYHTSFLDHLLAYLFLRYIVISKYFLETCNCMPILEDI